MGEFSALVTDPSADGLQQLAAWKDARVVVQPGMSGGEGEEEEEAGAGEPESGGEVEERGSEENEGRAEEEEEEGRRDNGDMQATGADSEAAEQVISTSTNSEHTPNGDLL